MNNPKFFENYFNPKTGLYEAKVTVGKDTNGCLIRKNVRRKTAKEFYERLCELGVEERFGKSYDAELLFDYYANKYMDDVVDYWTDFGTGIKNETRITNERSIVNRLLGRSNKYVINKSSVFSFGGMKVTDIRAEHIKQFARQMAVRNPQTGRPTSQEQLRRYMNTLRSIMELAVDAGAIIRNPCSESIKYARGRKAQPRTNLTSIDENIVDWIFATPHRCQIPTIVGMFAGLRNGELFGLRWCDIDLENAELKVTQSMDSYTGRIKKGGKSERAVRTIHIPPEIIELLKRHRAELGEVYLVERAPGEPITNSTWDSWWRSYLNVLDRKYGTIGKASRHGRFQPTGPNANISIPYFTYYSCRHQFVTMLDEADVEMSTRKAEAGHASERMSEHYTHRADAKNKENMSAYHSKVSAVYGAQLADV